MDDTVFLHKIAGFLGTYYLILAAMNGVAALYMWLRKDRGGLALVWLGVALFFVILSPLAMSGAKETMPGVQSWFTSLEGVVNYATGPVVYSLGATLLLTLMFLFRRFFVNPVVAWSLLNIVLLLMGLSITNKEFAEIVTKPDNVPIVGLVYLLGFFTWLATAKAVENDDRIARGLPPTEKDDSEKVLVWPDLVYTELICMIALTALLLVWAILLKAPLEEPASSVKTPNPSKAPWYFLGLQEMLVYFDPWYAGVVLPSVVVAGLMAIPYLDFNKKGNGYYTIAERKFSYLVFQFGFLDLWITLIILGTFLRGPNWNIFGPFEHWDPHKVLNLTNRDLSDYFWVGLFHLPMPKAPTGSSAPVDFLYILLREAPGILSMAFYLLALPPLMATTVFRNFYAKLGFWRYMVMSNLFLLMLTLPIKMVLRWVFNLKYIISIPEYFLNF